MEDMEVWLTTFKTCANPWLNPGIQIYTEEIWIISYRIYSCSGRPRIRRRVLRLPSYVSGVGLTACPLACQRYSWPDSYQNPWLRNLWNQSVSPRVIVDHFGSWKSCGVHPLCFQNPQCPKSNHAPLVFCCSWMPLHHSVPDKGCSIPRAQGNHGGWCHT